MTNYTKTMREALQSMYISEDNIAILRDIVKRKSAMPLKFADGKMKVDLFTASAVTQALDKVNPANKAKITKMINTGKKANFMSVAKVVMKSENDPEIEEEEVKVEEVSLLAQQAAILISKRELERNPRKEEVELDEEKMPSHAELVKGKYGDAHAGAQHFSNIDGKVYTWNYLERKGGKYVVTTKKTGEIGLSRAGSKDFKTAKIVKEEVELDEKIEGLVTKAKKSGMPYGILKKVYDRGMAAYKTGHRPGTTSQQWAFARVNSFVTKSAGTWGKADADLAKQVRGESVEEKDVEALSMVQLAAIAISEKERGENPKKKDEEVELDENFKKMSNDKLKAWLSKNDTEDSVSPVFGNQLKLAKRELISRGLKMKEEVDLDEGLVKKGIDLENAAKRSKNPVESDGSDKNDKKDMLKVAAMLKKGDRSGVVKFAKTLDDDRRLQTFGISLSPQEYVEDLLEEVDLDEARQLKNPKKEVMVVKKGKVEVIDKKDAKEYLNKGYSLAEASARADAMRAMRKGKTVDPADVDTDASDDDVKSASKNIIMQLRKSVSLRGNFPVEFTDKKKVKVSAKIAQAVQNKHNSMKKANDKEKFQAKVSKSYKDMLSALKENTILDKISKKLKEIKNG